MEGYTLGFSPYSVPVSSNLFTVGANYNISHNEWGGNLSAMEFDSHGNWTFNPSVSAMIAPERTTNLLRGKGFKTNDQVLARFVAKGEYQKALDYFRFKGKYNPEKHESEGGVESKDYYGYFDEKTKEINYGRPAFESFDKLRATATKEYYHWAKVRKGGSLEKQNLKGYEIAPEEALGFKYAYKHQGLFRNAQINYPSNIEHFNLKTINNTSPQFPVKWWHFIYRVPRKY